YHICAFMEFHHVFFFFFQAEDGIRDFHVTGVQTCALPISTYSRQQALPRAASTGSDQVSRGVAGRPPSNSTAANNASDRPSQPGQVGRLDTAPVNTPLSRRSASNKPQ